MAQTPLDHLLDLHFGTSHPIDWYRTVSSAARSSYALEDVDLRFKDGNILRLVFKDLSRQGLLREARRIKPGFLYNPLREIEMYRSILEDGSLGTARCYGTLSDLCGGRYALLLERVGGVSISTTPGKGSEE